MDLELRLADLERRVANMLRGGTVAQIDHDQPRVRVQSGDLLTDWRPWFAHRAGATTTWSPPTIGEQVLLVSPSGDPAQAMVLPALYTDAHPAPSASPDEHVTAYPDGARIAYNHDTGALTANGIQTAVIDAATSVTLDTPIVTCTGQLVVEGLLTYKAGLSGTGGGPGTVITGSITQTGGQITSNGIALDAHTHSGVQPGGGSTGGPQ